MKSHKLIFIFSLTLMGALSAELYPGSASAEDNLVALQRDVLAAKKASASFAGKVKETGPKPTRQVTFDRQASDLMSELTGKTSVSTVEPNEKSSVSQGDGYMFKYPSPRSFEPKPNIEPRSAWIFDRVPKFFGKGKNEAYELSDGNALYKVAVSDGKITMKEAVDIAVANSIGAQALKKRIDVAKAKLMEAKRSLYPTVQLQLDENGGISPNSRAYRGRSQKINVNQPLYYGGELVLTVKQAEEGVLTAEADLEKAKNELIQQVRTAYYGVVKAEYNEQYQKELLREVEAIRKIIVAANNQKVIAHIDFLNMESQMQQVKFSADSTSNDTLAAYLTLRQAMNLESMVPLPVDLRLTLKKIAVDFDLLLDFAMQNSPDLMAKQAAYLSAVDGIKIYEAKKRPRFDLRGSYGQLGEVNVDTQAVEDGNSNLDLEKEWYLGVHASMPLGASTIEYDQIKHVFANTVSAFQGSQDYRHSVKFNLLDKFSDITDSESAAAALLQAEADWQKTRNDIVFKLKEHFYTLQKSVIQIDSATARMRYQEKQNNIFKYSMLTQDSPVSSYVDGMTEQASNRFSFIQAVTDYNTAVSDIAVLCGNPEYFASDDE